MEATSTNSGIRRGILLTIGALVVAGAVTLGLLLTWGSSSVSAADQLASVQTACQEWLSTNAGQPGNGRWCTDMGDWMSEDMSHNGVGPEMMWGDASHLLTTCEQWMSASPPAGSTITPRDWCSSMVNWMTSHTSSWTDKNGWDGWMNHGPMMGGN